MSEPSMNLPPPPRDANTVPPPSVGTAPVALPPLYTSTVPSPAPRLVGGGNGGTPTYAPVPTYQSAPGYAAAPDHTGAATIVAERPPAHGQLLYDGIELDEFGNPKIPPG